MSDFWPNVIGLTISSGFIVFLFARLARFLRTRTYYYFRGGRRISADEQPSAYRYYMTWQLIGTAFWVWLYGLLLYTKFIADTNWMSR